MPNKYEQAHMKLVIALASGLRDEYLDNKNIKESLSTLKELIEREKEVEAIANDCNELIDKSMPKKFKKINKYEYECPSCKELYDLNDVNYNYCPNCSQKIDWSDWV